MKTKTDSEKFDSFLIGVANFKNVSIRRKFSAIRRFLKAMENQSKKKTKEENPNGTT